MNKGVIFITADGTWGDRDDLLIVHLDDLTPEQVEMYDEMLDGADASELYRSLL
jgi:hypothetical protein